MPIGAKMYEQKDADADEAEDKSKKDAAVEGEVVDEKEEK